jgi:hypothetical protein
MAFFFDSMLDYGMNHLEWKMCLKKAPLARELFTTKSVCIFTLNHDIITINYNIVVKY